MAADLPGSFDGRWGERFDDDGPQMMPDLRDAGQALSEISDDECQLDRAGFCWVHGAHHLPGTPDPSQRQVDQAKARKAQALMDDEDEG